MKQTAMHFNTFHYKNKQKRQKTEPTHTNQEEIWNYPQTIVGWIACMSCFQSDAWCHQTKLKIQRYGQVTVILAANIPIGV